MNKDIALKLKGERVHFHGYNKGCNWILRKIEGERCICITPKTRKEFIGKLENMYPSKKNLHLINN